MISQLNKAYLILYYFLIYRLINSWITNFRFWNWRKRARRCRRSNYDEPISPSLPLRSSHHLSLSRLSSAVHSRARERALICDHLATVALSRCVTDELDNVRISHLGVWIRSVCSWSSWIATAVCFNYRISFDFCRSLSLSSRHVFTGFARESDCRDIRMKETPNNCRPIISYSRRKILRRIPPAPTGF